MKRTIEIDVVLTPEDLAKIWCDMDSEQQAIFFNAVAKIVKSWPIDVAFQLQWITDSEALTDDGRRIMADIGNYAWKEAE